MLEKNPLGLQMINRLKVSLGLVLSSQPDKVN